MRCSSAWSDHLWAYRDADPTGGADAVVGDRIR
jgi:hypothetical protein